MSIAEKKIDTELWMRNEGIFEVEYVDVEKGRVTKVFYARNKFLGIRFFRSLDKEEGLVFMFENRTLPRKTVLNIRGVDKYETFENQIEVEMHLGRNNARKFI